MNNRGDTPMVIFVVLVFVLFGVMIVSFILSSSDINEIVDDVKYMQEVNDFVAGEEFRMMVAVKNVAKWHFNDDVGKAKGEIDTDSLRTLVIDELNAVRSNSGYVITPDEIEITEEYVKAEFNGLITPRGYGGGDSGPKLLVRYKPTYRVVIYFEEFETEDVKTKLT